MVCKLLACSRSSAYTMSGMAQNFPWEILKGTLSHHCNVFYGMYCITSVICEFFCFMTKQKKRESANLPSPSPVPTSHPPQKKNQLSLKTLTYPWQKHRTHLKSQSNNSNFESSHFQSCLVFGEKVKFTFNILLLCSLCLNFIYIF